jgi:hypothetical protein
MVLSLSLYFDLHVVKEYWLLRLNIFLNYSSGGEDHKNQDGLGKN